MSNPALLDLSRAIVVAIGLLMAGAAFATAYRLGTDRIERVSVATALTGGDAVRAPGLMRRYGCAGCHTIPGIAGADGKVGGDLAGLRTRVYIAGKLQNNSDNLIQWIVAPQEIDPGTAMPTTGITEAEARDVAAYLYAQQ